MSSPVSLASCRIPRTDTRCINSCNFEMAYPGSRGSIASSQREPGEHPPSVVRAPTPRAWPRHPVRHLPTLALLPLVDETLPRLRRGMVPPRQPPRNLIRSRLDRRLLSQRIYHDRPHCDMPRNPQLPLFSGFTRVATATQPRSPHCVSSATTRDQCHGSRNGAGGVRPGASWSMSRTREPPRRLRTQRLRPLSLKAPTGSKTILFAK